MPTRREPGKRRGAPPDTALAEKQPLAANPGAFQDLHIGGGSPCQGKVARQVLMIEASSRSPGSSPAATEIKSAGCPSVITDGASWPARSAARSRQLARNA